MSEDAKARVLVADDEASILENMKDWLEDDGHEVVTVATGDAAFEALAGQDFDIAFLDIRMPGASGLDVLERLRTLGSDTAIVIMTAESTFDNAMEAMKRGALDYLRKPFSLGETSLLVSKALRNRALEREVRLLRREVAGQHSTPERLIGRCDAMLEVFKTVGKVADSDVPVLVTGETGTGKERVARAIHDASSRASERFLAVNTAAIPRELLESELFGHERGAFTGAVESRPGRFREAAGGTLLLDEIGDMATDLQAKLLRVLQNGEVTSVGGKRTDRVDVRVVAATHRDLDQMVRDGGFREDLLYRLRIVPVHLPPLRERPGDTAGLAEHFVALYAKGLVGAPRYLSAAALERLAAHPWPGNVRELENAIKRALVLASSEVLTPEDFAFLDPAPGGGGEAVSLADLVRGELDRALDAEESGDVYRRVVENVERPLLEAALARTGGNQIKAAALLGINRNTLRKKIVDLDIPVPGRP
ncbi:MAG: sigma-54-dependent Fis family transcriptional regulator [Deltaproteobacteria bacterium]|nr:sigma-54-dependent Fis family transcriptional regulator [Deltaproteobacteria bacterium]